MYAETSSFLSHFNQQLKLFN